MPESTTQNEIREEAIEPDLAIIDPHHHLWPPVGGHSMAVPYSLADLAGDIGGNNVRATVYLECSSMYRSDGPELLRPVGETEWVASLPTHSGMISKIVGFADMLAGEEVGEVLDAHIAAGNGRFAGIRHSIGWDSHPEVINTARNPPEHVIADPVFRRGIAEVAKRGLTFETWGYFHQLDDIVELATEFPDAVIIVDHLGGPVVSGPYGADRPAMLEKWRAAIKNLKKADNIRLKLGGIGFPPFVEDAVRRGRRDSQTLAEYWGPELRYCIETLGPDRCMFESNFPVDKELCDYTTLWNVFKLITADLSVSERSGLFSGTAQKTYNIELEE